MPTPVQATAPAPPAGVDQVGSDGRVGIAHAPQRSAAQGTGIANGRVELVLERLGRCWPEGGASRSRGIMEAVRPYFGKLKEADRAVTRSSLDARFADARVTVLTRSVKRHDQRLHDLVQQVLHTRFQAARQKSSSGEAQLRRIADEWEQQLEEFRERFGGRPKELDEARRDSRSKQSLLRSVKKRVNDLEEAIGRFFPLIAPPDDGGDAGGPGANGHEPLTTESERDGHSEENEPVALVRAERTARARPRRAVNIRRIRRIRRSPRTFRGGIVRARRR